MPHSLQLNPNSVYVITGNDNRQAVVHYDGHNYKLYQQEQYWIVCADLPDASKLAEMAHQAVEVRKDYNRAEFASKFERVNLRQLMRPEDWNRYIVHNVAESEHHLTEQLDIIRNQASLKGKKVVSHEELMSAQKPKKVEKPTEKKTGE